MVHYLVSLVFALVLQAQADYSLESVIYTSFTGNPCVWLLNNEGGYGCHTTKDGNVGVLRFMQDQPALDKFLKNLPTKPEILVMEAGLALPNLEQLINDSPAASIAGILVLEGKNPSKPFSPAHKFPGRKHATTGFQWNPHGNGFMTKAFPFPLWALGVEDSKVVMEKAKSNLNRTDYPYFAGEIVAFMHPRTADTSIVSLELSTSKPIGGHSTVTTVSQYDSQQAKEVILAIAGMDSSSLFQLKTVGANADMSGTIALMAALDALLQPGLSPISSWKRHPVFAWFDAEHWGSLGSTKFIQDLKGFTCQDTRGDGPFQYCDTPYAPSLYFKNLSYDKIHSIIEPKQVGARNADGSLFVHQHHHQFDIPAAEIAFKLRVPGLVINRASDETAGVPPSSMLSFIEFDERLAHKGIVLTDHVAEYNNKFYESIFDTIDNVDPQLVCKAATALAQSISALGRDVVDPVKDSQISKITANCTLVLELFDCLAKNNTCNLRKEFLPGLTAKTTDEFPNHYSSVYFPGAYSQHQRFIHDWVVDRVNPQKPQNRTSCEGDDNCNGDLHQTCIRKTCQAASTTFYHEAKSNNTDFVIGAFSAYYAIYDKSSKEPFWSESDWTPISLRVFEVTNPTIDYVFLGVAIFETLIVFFIAFLAKQYFHQKFKVL